MPPTTLVKIYARFNGGLLQSEVLVEDNAAMQTEFTKFHKYTEY